MKSNLSCVGVGVGVGVGLCGLLLFYIFPKTRLPTLGFFYLAFILMSIIYFKLIFVYGLKQGSRLIFFHKNIQ